MNFADGANEDSGFEMITVAILVVPADDPAEIQPDRVQFQAARVKGDQDQSFKVLFTITDAEHYARILRHLARQLRRDVRRKGGTEKIRFHG